METKDKIEQILKKTFSIESMKITDDSAQHKGHAEALKSGGGHFSVVLVSADFNGQKMIDRHRLINNALKDLMKKEIHALAIKAYSLDEYKPNKV